MNITTQKIVYKRHCKTQIIIQEYSGFQEEAFGGYYKNIKREAKEYLRQNGIVSLDWNSLSKDAEGAHTKETLLQSVIDTVGNKQSVVILMHDAADKILTYETLPSVIQYLRENGYTFKNLYDIL